MKRPLYHVLAQKVQAIINCIASDNKEWEKRHGGDVEDLVLAHMPSGSGFDSGTKIDLDVSSADKLVFYTSFHHMDENGFYDGWTEHTVKVTPSLTSGFDLKIGGRDRREIKDYIAESFYFALRELVDDGTTVHDPLETACDALAAIIKESGITDFSDSDPTGTITRMAHLAHAALNGRPVPGNEAMFKALQVLTLTPHILEYLEQRDPKALEQARRAVASVKLAYSCTDAKERDEGCFRAVAAENRVDGLLNALQTIAGTGHTDDGGQWAVGFRRGAGGAGRPCGSGNSDPFRTFAAKVAEVIDERRTQAGEVDYGEGEFDWEQTDTFYTYEGTRRSSDYLYFMNWPELASLCDKAKELAK